MSDSPQSNKQHPVPQNIMDVEFKLIGDLTMRQFAYLMIAGLSAYLSYLVVFGIFKWPVVITFVLLGLGLAFVPVEERGLDEWIVNFFRAINSPTQKVWRKEPQLPTAFLYDNLAVVKQEMITLAPTSSRRKLEEYLRYKGDDGKEDPLDIPERAYAMKVREAYPYEPSSTSSSGVSVMLEESLPENEEFFKAAEEGKEENTGLETVDNIPVSVSVVEEDRGRKIVEEKPVIRTTLVGTPSVIIKGKAPENVGFKLPDRFEEKDSGYSFHPITPDMHSGRKFVNLVPSRGELTLPIRGERMLKTSEDLVIQDDVDEKAEKLNDLLEKIRKEEGIGKAPPKKVAPVVPEKPEEKLNVESKAKGIVNELETQKDELSSEIQRLKSQIERGKSMSLNTSTQEQLLRRLESQKEKIALSYTDLQQQFTELKKKLEEKNTESASSTFVPEVKKVIAVLTTEPNVVTGIVRDLEDKQLPNVLLIIKNMRGEAVRAFKSNSMGQFVVSTPLQNGMYTVEVSPTNKLDLTFGIIPIEVKGEVIPPLDIVGK